jgi:hypothetical protein
MAKRKPLSFDNDQLTKDLKESKGKGVDALFTPPPQTQKEAEQPIPPKEKSPVPVKVQTRTGKKESKQYDNMASNIAILQFTDDEIKELREPAYKAQTFRLTTKETEWVKDTAYRLSKEIKRGKVSQADILRISFRLFDNLLAINKAELIKILERIK